MAAAFQALEASNSAESCPEPLALEDYGAKIKIGLTAAPIRPKAHPKERKKKVGKTKELRKP